LGDVVGVGGSPRHAPGNAVDATIMAAEQRFERGTVAQASVLDEIVVGIVDSGWRNWRVLQQLQRRRRCELDRIATGRWTVTRLHGHDDPLLALGAPS